MPNTILTPTVIAKEALALLENQLVMGSNVHREFKKEFVKAGETVNIRKPTRFTVTESATLAKQDVTEFNTNVKIDTQAHVGWQFNSKELTLSIDEYSERYIRPAIVALANSVDRKLTGLYNRVNNQVGTPGTTPASFMSIAAGMQRLDELAAPSEQRKVILNPAANWTIADALKGLFDPTRVKEIVNRGYLGNIAGADVLMDQNIRIHTVGTKAGTPLVNGVPAQGANTIVTDGWTASSAVLKAGDVFTIANVFEVNPVSGQSTGVLKQFVSLSDVTADGTGNATITVYPTDDSGPGLRSTGAFASCSAMPADNAAITVLGTASTNYPMNLIYQKNAFALVSVPLEMPEGVWGSRVSDKQTGLSVRVVKQYDIDTDNEVCRLDILYGVKCIYPDLAVRLVG